MNNEHDQHSGDNEGERHELHSFEQQLRSVRPNLPQTSWEEVEMRLGENLGDRSEKRLEMAATDTDELLSPAAKSTSALVPAKNTTASMASWIRIATHAAATLVGIGIGVVVMLMLLPPVEGRGDSVPAGIATEDTVNDSVNLLAETKVTDVEFPNARDAYVGRRRRSYRQFVHVHDRNFSNRQLTPMTRNIDAFRWTNVTYAQETDGSEQSPEIYKPVPRKRKKPMSAPELLRELIKEQA